MFTKFLGLGLYNTLIVKSTFCKSLLAVKDVSSTNFVQVSNIIGFVMIGIQKWYPSLKLIVKFFVK